MTNTRKSYTKEFKLEAIHLAETSGKSDAQVEQELGLFSGALFRWRHALARQGADAFPGRGHLSPTEEQLHRLERENFILRQERDILKKAIAVLSPKSE